MTALARAWRGGSLQSLVPATARSHLTRSRLIHSSQIVRAASGGHSAEEEEYPTEGFSSPIWRNSILLTIAGFGIYRISTMDNDTHPSRASSSGKSAPEHVSDDDDEEAEDKRPFITRYMDYYSTPSSVWKERNERHLDIVREKAEEKLLFQDAERPPIHRLRYASTFEQASPHRLGVGMQADLSNLNIKREEAGKSKEEDEED